MSTENQNGSAGTQSNGIKTSISLSSSTRTVSNNSSFLYSSNSNTSSFNAGSNGSGTTERLSRDREVGGSYRLASLDRLALRQRILDGEKANGDTTSIQAKRELFFKGDNTGIISSPSVPSVPPPQPPSQAPSSVSTSSTTTTTTTTLASPNTAPQTSSTVYTSVTSSAPSSKPRLPPSTVILNQNDASEDSNKRESSRSSENNKETAVLHHPRPTPPTKPKELDGYVGFANLPNQVYRKAVKKGFDFTLMVVGESGLGKSTLINSMFLADIYSAEYPGPSLRVKKTVAVETSKVLLKENGVNLTLTVVDTPGFGDAVDNSNCWVPVIEYIESKYEEFLNAESRVVRRQIPDSRVHCCLYFVAPSGHGLKPLDVEFMQRLHDKVNIIPVIAKADTMTPDECAHFKKQILNEIAQHKIKIYEFPEVEEEEESKLHKVLRDRVPFAVVGANTVVEHDGRKVRGRKYPWGIAEVENLEHCDFIALRNMVIRTHLQDLKDVTNNVHYENFRCRTLAGVGIDGKPTKVSNKTHLQDLKDVTNNVHYENFRCRTLAGVGIDGKPTKVSNNLCPPGVMNSFMTVWNPLAQLEEEKREHDNKMKKMEIDMEQVFEMKVREKKQKLKESEADVQRRHEQMRRSLEQQVRELEEKRRAFEAEKLEWEKQTGHSIEELRRRSLEANSKE
ncbi:Septin-7 [Habropoda laboriosa]|uniref:Septin-7 n=1 Tax=Habropoda laboriosa TaxID=597456 RepID=A0A0L7R1E6_9HYME|nr:Septin-7 [Habropoda laboriosa]